MAKADYSLLDSDLHLMEPPDLYQSYLEEEYSNQAQAPTSDRARHYAGGTLEGTLIPSGTADSAVLKANEELDHRARRVIEQGWATKLDPTSSLRPMDAKCIDVAVMFRTSASMLVSVDYLDGGYALALCRTFNEWCTDHCREAPDRLIATATVPQHNPDLATREVPRAVDELGTMMVLLPMPILVLHLHDLVFDVLWHEIQRLGVPACFHGTSVAASKNYVAGRFAGHPNYRTLLHASDFALEFMLTMCSMVLGSVLEKFPDLKVAFLERNCSWLPWWLYRLGNQWDKFGAGEPVELSETPFTDFMPQCYISIDTDKHLAEDIVRRLGDENIIFSADYPHATDEFPSIKGLSPDTRRKTLWDNCARLYGL